MNAFTEDEPIDLVDDERLAAEEVEEVEESYQSLSFLAVLSLVFGLASILTVFTWFLCLIPMVGLLLGFLALRQIDRAPEEKVGRGVARVGMGLSVVLWALGGYLWAAWLSEVPPGYKVVTFKMLQPDKTRGQLPEKARELDDKRIFIKGFMYPGRQSIAIKSFILVPTRGHCKFCTANIPPTERIEIELVGDLTANFSTHLIGVGGRLTVNPSAGSGRSPYLVEADCLR